MKNLATPSSIFIFIFLIHRRALLSASQRQRSSNRANVPRTCWAKLFGPEYSFNEYFQLGSRRKVGPIKNQSASPNTSTHAHTHTHTHATSWTEPDFWVACLFVQVFNIFVAYSVAHKDPEQAGAFLHTHIWPAFGWRQWGRAGPTCGSGDGVSVSHSGMVSR